MRDKTIPERLKEIRSNTGMTQKAFALRFNIPISTYEQWEMGLRTPPVYVVDMIETIIHLERSDW